MSSKNMGKKRINNALKAALMLDQRGGEDEVRKPASEGIDRWTHGFHTYPAALHPDTVASLFELLPEGPVVDPFCGGGTVLIEGMVRGKKMYGRDLSPIAIKVAQLRTTIASEETLTAFRSAARKAAEEAKTAEEPPNEERMNILEAWYDAKTLLELESLRKAAMKAPEDIRSLMIGCFSSIVVKTSYRKSDTSAQKIVQPRPPESTAILFHKKARELARRLESFRNSLPENVQTPSISIGDARELQVPENIAGCITSPPYPGVYDYIPLQLLRHVWLGIRTNDGKEMGARRAFRGDTEKARVHWKNDTFAWMKRITSALKPDGRIIVITGDGQAGDRTIGTADPLHEIGESCGLKLIGRITLNRKQAVQTKRFEHALAFSLAKDY